MTFSFKRALLVPVAVLGGAGLCIGGWLWWTFARPLPNDTSLIERFRAHQSEFESLAALATADTLLVVAFHDPMLMRFAVYVRDTAHHDRRLSDEEVEASGRSRLRGLLDRVGMPSISRSRVGNTVWFSLGSRGGVRKGLVHTEEPLEPVFSKIEDFERSGALYGHVSLAPRWFLSIQPSD